MIKQCKNCDIEFETNRHNPNQQIFCSIKCQRAENYIRNKEKLSKIRKNKYLLNRTNTLNKVKEYAKNNKEKIKAYKKQYRSSNREKLRLVDKEYYKNNKDILIEKARIYLNNKYKTDAEYAIKERLKSRIRMAIRIYIEEKRIINSKEFKINYKEIIEHLKPFPKDITKYHIDHIKPLCTFNLNNEEEVKKAFAPENHQWLLAEENLKKGGKYEVYN